MNLIKIVLEFEKLSSAILALKLDCLKLSHCDWQLVLTDVSYVKRKALFEEKKTALQKFHGQQAIPIPAGVYTPIKSEPTLQNNDKAYYSKFPN